MAFVPGSWLKAPKNAWNFLSDGEAILWSRGAHLIIIEFTLMRWLRVWFLDNLRMALVARKTRWSEGWNFESHHQPPGEVRGAEPPFYKSSWTQIFDEFPHWGAHSCAGKAAHPDFTGEDVLVLRTLPGLTLPTPSPGCSFLFFGINQ